MDEKIILVEGERIESLMLGDLKIIQSDAYYKFTSDSVLLSRFAPCGKKKVLDLCSGSGIVGLHYYGLNLSSPPTLVTLCEIQRGLARMSEKSIALNGLEACFKVVNEPLQDFKGSGFDLVTCNPPYKKRGSGPLPADEGSAICRAEVAVTLKEIVEAAYRALKDGGSFCICHKAERLAELVFELFSIGFGVSRIQPICSKEGEKPYLVLVEGIKNRKRELTLSETKVNKVKNFAG